MKYYSSLSSLKFSWDQVASAFWNRYPNPHSSHVLTEDTVKRNVEGKKLYSTRLISKTNKMPKWGEKIIPGGTRHVCVVEESIVDVDKKTLTTYTRNIGLTKFMTIDEKVVYRPDPENKSQTLCERQAWIVSNLFGFSYALQAFGLDRFKKNAQKAVNGFEFVLNRMYLPELPESNRNAPKNGTKDKLKVKAKAATELAKQKAAVYATCTGHSAS
jgi:hypothetical protein